MELSQKQRQREVILHLWNQGVRTARVIQLQTGIGLSTIYYNLKKLNETGSVAQKKGQGRPKKITSSASHTIVQCIRHNPKISIGDLVNKLADKGVKVGRETVRTYLHSHGYKNALPLATPMLTATNKAKRVAWAQQHLNDDWSRTLFTDETSFQLFRNTITQCYKHKRPTRPSPKNRQKIHAWGGFYAQGKTSIYCFGGIMDADFYIEILKNQLPEVEEMLGNVWRFQQDNDPKHTSRKAKNFLNENVPVLIDWPSNSPDINPIENLWELLKRNVEKRKPRNLEDLERYMVEEWEQIPDFVLQNLIDSMTTKFEEVIKLQGERINY